MSKILCIVAATVLSWTGFHIGLNAAEEQTGTSFSILKTAEYLDAHAHDFENNCFACHATFAFLMARSALPGRSALAQETRSNLVQYLEKQKEPKPRNSTEAIMSAVALALQDQCSSGKLQPETRKALDRVWRLQRKDGGWDWLQSNEPPSAIDEHYGITMALWAVAVAGPEYASTPDVREGIRKTYAYLSAHPTTSLHQKIMLLLVSAQLKDVVPDVERAQTMEALFTLQHKDGGWATASLADWKRLDHSPIEVEKSDGYATGLVLLALRTGAGISAQDSRLQKAVQWLRTQQRNDGSWYTRSPRSRDDLATYYGTAFAVLALHACGELH